jgi:hypothetical protein
MSKCSKDLATLPRKQDVFLLRGPQRGLPDPAH